MLVFSENDPYKKKEHKHKAFAAHVMVTDHCNLNCFYCYYPARNQNELNPIQLGKVIEEYEKLSEPLLFYEVSGGEPLLHTRWPEMISMFLSTGRETVLSTNGTTLNESTVQKLREINTKYFNNLYLSISLDSWDLSVNDTIRGLGQQVLRGIQLVKGSNIPFRVSITLSRYNYSSLLSTIRHIVQQYASDVMVGILRPVFKYTCKEDAILSLSDIQRVYMDVENFRKEVPFNFHHCLGKNGETGCQAGIHRAAIGADGTVYPCYALTDMPLGNVFTSDLLPLLKTFGEKTKSKPNDLLLCGKL